MVAYGLQALPASVAWECPLTPTSRPACSSRCSSGVRRLAKGSGLRSWVRNCSSSSSGSGRSWPDWTGRCRHCHTLRCWTRRALQQQQQWAGWCSSGALDTDFRQGRVPACVVVWCVLCVHACVRARHFTVQPSTGLVALLTACCFPAAAHHYCSASHGSMLGMVGVSMHAKLLRDAVPSCRPEGSSGMQPPPAPAAFETGFAGASAFGAQPGWPLLSDTPFGAFAAPAAQGWAHAFSTPPAQQAAPPAATWQAPQRPAQPVFTMGWYHPSAPNNSSKRRRANLRFQRPRRR